MFIDVLARILLSFLCCVALSIFGSQRQECAAAEAVAELITQAREDVRAGDIRGAWRILDHAASNYPNDISSSHPVWSDIDAVSTESEEIGRVSIATWLNWAEGAASYTFDDRLESAVDVVLPDLNDDGFLGSFYVMRNSPTQAALSPLYEARWQSLASEGHEIGNHTMNHRKYLPTRNRLVIVNQLDGCQTFIATLEPRQSASTFAYPYGDHGRRNGPLRRHVRSRFAAARTTSGPRTPNPPIPAEMDVLQSYSVIRATTLDELDLLFEDTIASRGWLILNFHAVVSPPGWQRISRELWDGCREDLRERSGDLWIDTVRRIATYIYARSTALVMCEQSRPDQLRLSIRSQVPASLSSSPGALSVSIRVPSSWSVVRIVAADGGVSYHGVSGNRVTTNVIPDGQIYSINREESDG